ncbi:MAG TPA: serine/threonine-protein kinase, partial [Aggregatilineales bacterium]|nr:serine/threonine-protein kinase [Aggregatilineales bacterium]
MTSLSEKKLIGKRYIIEKELGRGGMGVVYLATDRLTREQVALKMVMISRDKLVFSSKSISTFDLDVALAKEFRLLSSLRHPHIISVLDYGFEEGDPYFTMELLNNPQGLLDAAWNESEEVRIRYLVELLQALTYIHRRGVIHRDIKPHNILVADGKIKVLDFGLAILSEEARQISMGRASGTIPYMAPEVLRGNAPSEASDLYAVGIITYQEFAKKHPFNVSSVSSLIRDILEGHPDLEPLERVILSKNALRSLSDIVSNLLEKRPDDRPQNAGQVIVELSEAAGTPVPEESVAIRNSFLESASFIGRDMELKQLTDAFQ